MQTVAQGINDEGQIVGYYRDSGGGYHGFLYSHGTYTNINDPLGTFTDPTGIDDGGVIVGYYEIGSQNYGFVATPRST